MAAVTDVGVDGPVAGGQGRTVQVRGRSIRVVPPTVRDPRVHVAAVIVSVQVLGQVVIGFDVSVAQILLTIGVCVAIEIPMVLWERGAMSWPASALLDRQRHRPVAAHAWHRARRLVVVERVAGVRRRGGHCDDQQVRGASRRPASLQPVQPRVGRGVPAVRASTRADPQDLWWGPWTPGLVATVVLIVVGGLTLSRRLGLGDVVAGFWLVFAAGVGVLALSGHEIDGALEPRAGRGLRLLAHAGRLARDHHLRVLHDHRSPDHADHPSRPRGLRGGCRRAGGPARRDPDGRVRHQGGAAGRADHRVHDPTAAGAAHPGAGGRPIDRRPGSRCGACRRWRRSSSSPRRWSERKRWPAAVRSRRDRRTVSWLRPATPGNARRFRCPMCPCRHRPCGRRSRKRWPGSIRDRRGNRA